jgi:hypothetical protein
MTMGEGPSSAKTVVFIYGGHPNDIEIAKYSALAFSRLGLKFETVNLADPRVAEILNPLLATRLSDVLCFVSPNYAAANIRVGGQLLHRATGVPLVFYLMDHPAYFLDLQIPEFEGALVFLPGQDLVEFVEDYYPPNTFAVDSREMSAPPFPLHEPRMDDFLGRRNVVLCPMNLAIWGQNMDGVWAQIQQLPAERRDGVVRLIDSALEDCFTPLHVFVQRLGFAEKIPGWHINDIKPALNFIKIWRRNHMVRELIDLPILVSSEYVPADLQFKYPQKFTSLSIAETLPLYQKHRFVLNASPLMTYSLHDRVMNALFGNSVAITDPNNWTAELMTDEEDVLIYDYAARNADKIARYIDDPEAAYRLTENAYDLRVHRNAFETVSFKNLISAVERRRQANGLP